MKRIASALTLVLGTCLHSPLPLAGEGPGVREAIAASVDSAANPLTACADSAAPTKSIPHPQPLSRRTGEGSRLNSPLPLAGEQSATDGLGVNIHFTDPRPGEMEMLAAGGFNMVRMDFAWGGTEREKGKYDFSAYDRLLKALEPHGIRALFILDYGNPLYDGGLAPHTDAGRKAFAAWAAAAATHFRGRGILWEMWNEPNIGFWKPEPNVENYAKLALEVGKALRAAAPDEAYIGPATSTIDFAFLEACFRAGLLEHWCAVSVHPYRQQAPETAIEEYARLRRLIDRYAPKGKAIPILSGEWGYSAAWRGYDPVKQGKMLPRQWLTNVACGVPVSIWYDWHDDGPDPKEPEHHFGTVLHPYHTGQRAVYEPKPAYLAAQTLTAQLTGLRYSKRLDVGRPDCYVCLFAAGGKLCVAAWTTAAEPQEATIPASPGRFAVTGHAGQRLPAIVAEKAGLVVRLNDAPQFFVPEGHNDLLRVAAEMGNLSGERAARSTGPFVLQLDVCNPLDRPIAVAVGDKRETLQPKAKSSLPVAFDGLPRSEAPTVLRIVCRIEGLGEIAQSLRVTATNPLRVALGPIDAPAFAVRIENPSGEPFRGEVRLVDLEGLHVKHVVAKIALAEGEKQKDVVFSVDGPLDRDVRLGVKVVDDEGREATGLPTRRLTRVDDFAQYAADSLAKAYRVLPDGDAKVASEATLAAVAAPPGLPGGGTKALKLTYRMDQGWKFLRVAPQTKELQAIDGRPAKLGLWLFGDGSGNSPRLRFVDSTGQTHQPTADPIAWKGWRYVEFRLDGQDSGHWSGADDGRVHPPIRWDTLFLLDSAKRAGTAGEVYLAAPVLVH